MVIGDDSGGAACRLRMDATGKGIPLSERGFEVVEHCRVSGGQGRRVWDDWSLLVIG